MGQDEIAKICFFDGKAFLEVSEGHFIHLGDEAFIKSLDKTEIRSLVRSTMLEIKNGTKEVGHRIHPASTTVH